MIIKEPVFVASLTIGDYVYFFIRENALEYMNFGGVFFFNKRCSLFLFLSHLNRK